MRRKRLRELCQAIRSQKRVFIAIAYRQIRGQPVQINGRLYSARHVV